MELDTRNISRLLQIYMYRMKKNRKILIKRSIALIYLYGFYTCMILYYSYNIYIADKPISYFLLLLKSLGIYILYVAINHLLIRRVIQNRTLLIFDMLSLIMLFCIFITEGWVSSCHP